MKKHPVKILTIEHITHDVLKIVTQKPPDYNFTPGQATEITINKDGWVNEKRPFTFTCLPEQSYLEFSIKTYTDHKGVTNKLLRLKENDELILHDVFGAIAYKKEGVFIAGGAGVTPFISILRDLRIKNETGNNKLIFANKTKGDIILDTEFKLMLGKNFINILSEEKANGYAYGQITKDFLKDYAKDPKSYFYVCGPPPMMKAIESFLSDLHVDKRMIVKEAF